MNRFPKYPRYRSALLFRRIAVPIFVLACSLPTPLLPTFLLSRAVAGEVSAASPPAGVIVIGFVGGFVHSNDAIHQEVQLFSRLQNEHPAGMQARIFRNHDGRQAHHTVMQLLGAGPSGLLPEQSKKSAHIILYGHSWGASEVVALARTLERDGIPVLLTIQVDSVSKFGEDDRWIPANVAQAVNFYQLNGVIHGQREIKAVDALRTKILGNFQFSYADTRINTDAYPWYARAFMRPHIEIESDPKVWNQVESLIRSKVHATAEIPH